MKRNHAVALLLALPLFAGCYSDDSLNPPAAPPVPSGGAVFQRFVSMGNSITAGFQSGGINDSTQQRAFPVLVAQAAGAEFNIPHLNMPGCPSPYTNNVTRTHVGGIPDATYRSICFGRVSNSGDINNVAVPGAGVLDMFSNFATPVSIYEQLSAFFLGGRTEIQAMQQRRPTLVSLEIGPNDVLGALISDANPGDPAEVTSAATFDAAYTELADSLAATGASVVVFTVPDVTVIPFASKGATYWCLRTGACPGVPQQLPPALTVANNCAPAAAVPGAKGDSTLIPWTKGLPRIAAAAQGAPQTIDCSVDSVVVTQSEYANMRNAVVAFNATVQAQAAAHNWAVVDLNAILQGALANGTIPSFPDISRATTGGAVTFQGFTPQGARLDPSLSLFSLDGFHPSTLAHRTLADALAGAINAKYGTTLPIPVCGAITCPAP
ncbi:MAG TPA: SGNH/GDSL hydrolase family protein [Gemmatimonadales bacterium]|nr:SGNH/GDSL hydrolase family protein [Gemmatimonadales bacterium]